MNLEEIIPGAKHFRWQEALWLPRWSIHVFPNKEQIENIIHVASKMELIRSAFGDSPIKIHSWLRPEMYNRLVGGAIQSMHTKGGAVDFSHPHLKCDDIRELLLPKLSEWKIRVEDNPGSSWVHVDIREPSGAGRFFKPSSNNVG